VGDKKNIITCA